VLVVHVSCEEEESLKQSQPLQNKVKIGATKKHNKENLESKPYTEGLFG